MFPPCSHNRVPTVSHLRSHVCSHLCSHRAPSLCEEPRRERTRREHSEDTARTRQDKNTARTLWEHCEGNSSMSYDHRAPESRRTSHALLFSLVLAPRSFGPHATCYTYRHTDARRRATQVPCSHSGGIRPDFRREGVRQPLQLDVPCGSLAKQVQSQSPNNS